MATRDAWALQDAKNRLSELVRKAREEGPQIITLRGEAAAVVLGADEYARLTRRKRGSLADFFRGSPLVGVDIDVARDRDIGRDVEL